MACLNENIKNSRKSSFCHSFSGNYNLFLVSPPKFLEIFYTSNRSVSYGADICFKIIQWSCMPWTLQPRQPAISLLCKTGRFVVIVTALAVLLKIMSLITKLMFHIYTTFISSKSSSQQTYVNIKIKKTSI